MKNYRIVILAALLFAACDKIADDEYTIYAGPEVAWTAGDASVAPVQCAYVEKYTGPKCANCPLADQTLAAAHHTLGDRLVLISVNHPKGQGEPFSGQPDMRTDDGTAWDNYWGINAIPAAYINRRTDKQYSGSMANITADISAACAESPVLGVSLTADDSDGDGKADIRVNIVFAQQCSQALTLTLAITEDSVAYRQLDGENVVDDYIHNHMLRDVITDVWGADIDCTGAAGEAVATTVSYTLPDAVSGSTANFNIVALVSDKSTRQVLNSASCRIN